MKRSAQGETELSQTFNFLLMNCLETKKATIKVAFFDGVNPLAFLLESG